MAGTVIEWTRSQWGEDAGKLRFVDPSKPGAGAPKAAWAEDEIKWVVRGGSWDFPRGYARCASRSRCHPDVRGGGLGFRVVLRSSPIR